MNRGRLITMLVVLFFLVGCATAPDPYAHSGSMGDGQAEVAEAQSQVAAGQAIADALGLMPANLPTHANQTNEELRQQQSHMCPKGKHALELSAIEYAIIPGILNTPDAMAAGGDPSMAGQVAWNTLVRQQRIKPKTIVGNVGQDWLGNTRTIILEHHTGKAGSHGGYDHAQAGVAVVDKLGNFMHTADGRILYRAHQRVIYGCPRLN